VTEEIDIAAPDDEVRGTAPLRVAVPLALVAGGAWALAAPPRGWWPLLSLGVAAWTIALYGRGLRARVLLGTASGVACFGPGLWWLNGFAVPGYVGIALLETGMLAAAAALVPAARTGRWAGGWWAAPLVLALLDAAQTRFPFGGFPLPALVLSQAGGPFALAAPLGGSLLVTAAAAAAGVAVAAVVVLRARARLIVVAGITAALAVVLGTGAAITTTSAGTLDAAVVQGGGPRGLRAVFTDPQATTDRQFAAAQRITGRPDLVLFPENVVTVTGPVAGTAADARTAALARTLGAPVVVGVVEAEGSGFRNAAVLWGPDGRRLDRYEKQHRVPFGEYIPARALLERVTDLTALVPRDAIVGQGPALLRSPAGPLGVVISYEVLFADRVRDAVTSGGRILLVPTNAASYTTEEVPAIELAAARLRAREFGRTVLQAAPTGYSAVVLPDGTVVDRSGLGTPSLLRAQVPLRTGLTPYAATGDTPVLVLTGLVLLAVGAMARVRRRPGEGA